MEHILVYGITGFLDSGKTSLIKETLNDPDFMSDGFTSLIIQIEEGEVDFDEKYLEDHLAYLVRVNSTIDLTDKKLIELVETYRPDQIFIEFNGMETTTEFFERELPRPLVVVQVLTTIDASTFEVYVNNMRSLVYEHCKYSDLIIFNRCNEKTKRSVLRGNVKAINQRAQIVYEDINGVVNQLGEDELPFDLSSDVLDISDADYGIWYMDCAEHPEKYDGKKVILRGMYLQDIPELKQTIVFGRQALVCCEDDTSMIALSVTGVRKEELVKGEWILVEGELRHLKQGDDETIVLYATKLMEYAEPRDKYVTFS